MREKSEGIDRMFGKRERKPVAYLTYLRPLVWLFLSAWLWARLCVPFQTLSQNMERMTMVVAGLLAAGILWGDFKLHLTEHFLLSLGWKSLLTFGIAFVLGCALDVTPAMLDVADTLLNHPLSQGLCRAGSGVVLGFIAVALVWAGNGIHGLYQRSWWVTLALFLSVNLVTLYYVLTSRTVYYWDTAGYWMTAQALAATPFRFQQILDVLETVIHADYNQLLAFPISLVMRPLGGTRAVFLFSIANFYTFPALLGLAAMGEKDFDGLALALLFPMLLYTSIDGFVDTASCALALWAYVVYNSKNPPLERGILSGALLTGTFLLRRYFFFFAASFGLAALIRKILFERKNWRDFLALFASTGVCTLAFHYVFLLEKVLGTDFQDIYSSYARGLSADFSNIVLFFGVVVPLLIFLAVLTRLRCREDWPVLTFACVQGGVCFLAFTTIQTHDLQHLLMYIPMAGILAETALGAAGSVRRSVLALTAAVCCLLALFPSIPVPKALFSSLYFHGEKRSDIDQLLALEDFLDSLSSEEQKHAAVLASGFDFNSETLTNLRPSLNLPEPEQKTVIDFFGTVDKRDLFNWNVLYTDYLVIGDPIQTHLGEENQQIMVLFARDVLDGIRFGRAYRLLPETFELQYGIKVRIYERMEDPYPADFFDLSERFTALYPNYAEQYAVPEWIVEWSKYVWDGNG